jgi:hypothetical protein
MQTLISVRFFQFIFSLVFSVVFCLYARSAFAQSGDRQFFPLTPRLTVSASLLHPADTENVEGMAPFWGNHNGHLYVDMEGQSGSDKSWFGGIGLGGRQMISSNLLIGAYGFLDRSQTIDDTDAAYQWLSFNPGIEFMTLHWDGRINGYFPVGQDRHEQKTIFGDQLGLPDKAFFHGHQQLGELFHQYLFIGKGADVDAGYTFSGFHHLRIHGGGYLFNLPVQSGRIRGVEAGVEVPLNPYVSLSLDDTQDNIHKNNVFLSLKLTLGGIHPSRVPTIQERLLDPVHRHLGTQNIQGGIFVGNRLIDTGRKLVEQDNIWFFRQNSAQTFDIGQGNNNCTFEHPCSSADFNQSSLNGINSISSDAKLYLSPGAYAIKPRLSLNTGQSLYGRTNDYTLPASVQTGFPVLTGSLEPKGNNILDSFELLNDNGAKVSGINIINANNITMNNLWIGNSNAQEGFAVPLSLNNAQNILLEHSTLNAFGKSDTDGIYIKNTKQGITTLTVINNTFNINNTGKSGNVVGIYNDPGDGQITVNAQGNIFNINGGGDFLAGISNVLFDGGAITVNSRNNTFNINSHGNEDLSSGINNTLFSPGAITVNSSGDSFNLNAYGSDGFASGIHSDLLNNGTITVNATGDNFNITGNNRMTTGIESTVFSNGVITINANHNNFNLASSEPEGFVYGVKTSAPEGEAIVNIGNNIFNLTAPDHNNEIDRDNSNGGTINDLGGNGFNHH